MSDVYLSEEFAKFSKEIAVLREQKQKKKEEFKKVYDKYQTEVSELDQQVHKLTTDWEAFVTSSAEEK